MSYNEIVWMIVFSWTIHFFFQMAFNGFILKNMVKSTIPIVWWLSFFGGLITFFYAFNIKSFLMFAQFIV